MQPLPLSLKVPALGLPLFPGPSSRKRDAGHETTSRHSSRTLKSLERAVDTGCMIVSGEQTRLAARYAEPPLERTARVHADVPPELMDRIVSAIEAVPEVRADRVMDAVERLESATPRASEIADLIIARAICDGLR